MVEKNGAGFRPDVEDIHAGGDEAHAATSSVNYDEDMERPYRPSTASKVLLAGMILFVAIVAINFIGYVLDIPGGFFN